MAFFDELQRRTAAGREALFAIPVIHQCLAGRVRRDQYVAFLREAYHHVKETVPLLLACRVRLGSGREAVRAAVDSYVEEEQGHEQWILDDLRACGEDAEAVRAARPAAATERMVRFVRRYIEHVNPVGFFGMAYVLEGASAALATPAAAAIAGTLGLPGTALRYLTSHGALDQEHVRFFAGVVNALPEADQESVVEVANAVFRLYGELFRGLPA